MYNARNSDNQTSHSHDYALTLTSPTGCSTFTCCDSVVVSSRPPAECHFDSHRRHGMDRSFVLRQQILRNAEYRPPRGQRHAADACLLRMHCLLTETIGGD